MDVSGDPSRYLEVRYLKRELEMLRDSTHVTFSVRQKVKDEKVKDNNVRRNNAHVSMMNHTLS
jgi:hypothetical protein